MSPMLIFYDGECPICCAKRDFLKRRDTHDILEFSDIRHPGFTLPIPDMDFQLLEAEIHSITPDGSILRGMEVIRSAYHVIGLGWLAAPTGWPVLRPVFDWIYTQVAGNRKKISRAFGFTKR